MPGPPSRHSKSLDDYAPFGGTVPDLVHTDLHDGLVCTCGPREQESADALVADVRRRLVDEAGLALVTPDNFATAVVHALGQIDAHVTGLFWDATDFLVLAERTDHQRDAPATRFVSRIQCDRVEDGLAKTWEVFTARFGLEHP